MSKLLLHELHPSVVHAPLALLPTAAVADLIAVTTGDAAWEKVGRRLWVVGTGSALFAGWAGLAASQEVRMEEGRARDMVYLHGALNGVVTLAAVGVTAWRATARPTATQVALSLGAVALSLYTATLGGKMVYDHGVGINPMPDDAPQGTLKGPALLSLEAPGALVKDGVAGLRWLWARTRRLLAGTEPLAAGAKGFGRGQEDSPFEASKPPRRGASLHGVPPAHPAVGPSPLAPH
jgi:uncharacterized membrane protein